MRIIDKNTDFYDFYQNIYPDKTFTFDRRDSFVLTKEIVCEKLPTDRYYSYTERTFKNKDAYHLLLQICNTFWLFKLKVTKFTSYNRPKDYTVEFLSAWRNFNKERTLIQLDVVKFGYFYRRELKTEDLVDKIDRNDYRIEKNLNCHTLYTGTTKTDKHIPLLKASGFAPLMDPHEVFLAFEEYFALEKSASERRDPVGTTDIDKIESHGFDKKSSFRGK